MRQRRAVKSALVPLLVVVLASCTHAAPSPSLAGQFGNRPVLGISNGTTLTVTVFVNDQPVATSTPGVGTPAIDVNRLPPFPWTVEARSASGRVLTTMVVTARDITTTLDSSGLGGTTGTMGRVDLSCGRITIWAGYFEPSGPVPDPSAGFPGDCAP